MLSITGQALIPSSKSLPEEPRAYMEPGAETAVAGLDAAAPVLRVQAVAAEGALAEVAESLEAEDAAFAVEALRLDAEADPVDLAAQPFAEEARVQHETSEGQDARDHTEASSPGALRLPPPRSLCWHLLRSPLDLENVPG